MIALNEDIAYQLSHNWFLVDGEDRLIVGGVSLGLVFQLLVFEYFFKQANETKHRSGIKGILKARHLEWSARFFHSYLTQKKGVLNHVDLLTVYDVNNTPMIESANLVADTCKCQQLAVAGVVVDKSLCQQASNNIDILYLTNAYGVVDELAAMKMARKQLKNFNCFYSSYCIKMSEYELSIKETVYFLRFIKKQIHQLCREIVALDNLLGKLTPKAILLTSDAHRIGRIVVQLAKSRGISTYVIQHGAPIWKYGYVPVVADKMLVWGGDAFDWFVSHGVPAEKLNIVGNPRFDNLTLVELKKNNCQPPKVLLLPNPIDRALISRMISSFILSTRSHDGPVIIKLHPSETDIEWFQREIPAQLKNKIHISTRPLNELDIGLGDIAVVANSTAGVDVVLLGGAIVNVELPGMPNPIPYSKYMVGVNTNLENIGDAIFKAKKMSQEKWLENRTIFLENFLYRLDGMSADRAANIIVDSVRKGL